MDSHDRVTFNSSLLIARFGPDPHGFGFFNARKLRDGERETQKGLSRGTLDVFRSPPMVRHVAFGNWSDIVWVHRSREGCPERFA